MVDCVPSSFPPPHKTNFPIFRQLLDAWPFLPRRVHRWHHRQTASPPHLHPIATRGVQSPIRPEHRPLQRAERAQCTAQLRPDRRTSTAARIQRSEAAIPDDGRRAVPSVYATAPADGTSHQVAIRTLAGHGATWNGHANGTSAFVWLPKCDHHTATAGVSR